MDRPRSFSPRRPEKQSVSSEKREIKLIRIFFPNNCSHQRSKLPTEGDTKAPKRSGFKDGRFTKRSSL